MWISAGGFERSGLRLDAVEQILPGFDERLGSFALKVGREYFIRGRGYIQDLDDLLNRMK